MLDAGYAVDRGLDQVGDAGINDFRIGTLERGGHRDDGEFDERQPVHAYALIADDAEQYQHRRQHPRQNVTLDG
jgi:hypothetical protein